MKREEITEAVFDELIAHVSDGKTLTSFCRDRKLPTAYAYEYINEHEDRQLRFARARETGHEVIAEECMKIADTPQEGIETEESENGLKVKKADMLGHRKLQIWTRLQLLSKWNPKKYGDKLDVTSDGKAINQSVVVPTKDTATDVNNIEG